MSTCEQGFINAKIAEKMYSFRDRCDDMNEVKMEDELNKIDKERVKIFFSV